MVISRTRAGTVHTPSTPRTNTAATHTPTAPQSTTWAAGTSPRTRPAMLEGVQSIVLAAKVEKATTAAFASEIAGVPVKSARTLAYAELQGDPEALVREGFDVQFGKLTQAQFTALHSEFGGRSKVTFNASREYGVTDFAPPFVQALVNRDIDLSPTVTLAGSGHLREGRYEGEDFSLYSYTNCHGTAWETMRAFQNTPREVTLGFGDGFTVDGLYRDEAQFAPVGRAESADAASLSTLASSLKPGDVLVYREGEGVALHSATYLGGGLVFEKPDTERDADGETPYRYTTLSKSVRSIAQANFDTEFSVVALRPKQALPTLTEAFAFPDTAKLEQWAQSKGTTLGRPVVVETEMGGFGAIVGQHAVAAVPKVIELDANQLGVIKDP